MSLIVSRLFNELKSLLPKGLPIYEGREALSANVSPPILVLYPTRDDYAPPDRLSAEPGRVAASRVVGFELVLWGRDYTQTEGMIHEVVATLRKIAAAQLRLDGGEWGDEGVNILGRVYFLRFSIFVPIIIPERYTVLEEIATKCEVKK